MTPCKSFPAKHVKGLLQKYLFAGNIYFKATLTPFNGTNAIIGKDLKSQSLLVEDFLKGTFDVSFERVQKKLSGGEAGFLLMSDSSEGWRAKMGEQDMPFDFIWNGQRTYFDTMYLKSANIINSYFVILRF